MERNHKHKADYGISDYRKYYKDNYGEIDDALYKNIIKDYNESIIELIIEDNLIYTLPYIYFEIVIKKSKRKPKLVNGILINPNPIDWKTTKELWEKDAEAKEKKLRVRFNNSHTSGYVFRIYCKKFKSKLKYRSYFKFKPNRKFQRRLAKRINDPNKDNFDAFLLYKTKK